MKLILIWLSQSNAKLNRKQNFQKWHDDLNTAILDLQTVDTTCCHKPPDPKLDQLFFSLSEDIKLNLPPPRSPPLRNPPKKKIRTNLNSWIFNASIFSASSHHQSQLLVMLLICFLITTITTTRSSSAEATSTPSASIKTLNKLKN